MPQQQDVELMDHGHAADPGATTDQLVLDAFRRWGYLGADLDPLGFWRPEGHPELALEGEAARRARGWYCGPIGVEFMHIPDPGRRRWIQERMEQPMPAVDGPAVLDRLVRAELF